MLAEDHQQECAKDGTDFLRKNTKRSWKNTKNKKIERAKISAKVNLANTSDYTETGDG